MTGSIRERLSALADDELEQAEAEALLLLLLDDAGLRQEWEQLHRVRDLLHGEVFLIDASTIALQVHQRLITEPTLVARPAPPPMRVQRPRRSLTRQRWLLPTLGALGGALAASLATAVLLLPGSRLPDLQSGAQVVEQYPTPPGGSVARHSSPPTASPAAGVATVSLSSNRWKNLAEGSPVERKLNDYLVDHGQIASPMGVVRVGPYATFVSYGGE